MQLQILHFFSEPRSSKLSYRTFCRHRITTTCGPLRLPPSLLWTQNSSTSSHIDSHLPSYSTSETSISKHDSSRPGNLRACTRSALHGAVPVPPPPRLPTLLLPWDMSMVSGSHSISPLVHHVHFCTADRITTPAPRRLASRNILVRQSRPHVSNDGKIRYLFRTKRTDRESNLHFPDLIMVSVVPLLRQGAATSTRMIPNRRCSHLLYAFSIIPVRYT